MSVTLTLSLTGRLLDARDRLLADHPNPITRTHS